MLQIVGLGLCAWFILRLAQCLVRRARTTSLSGPPRPSLIFGVSEHINGVEDPGLIYEQWATKYGQVFSIPTVLGSSRIVLCDPKAISHYFSLETSTYVRPKLNRMLLKGFIGQGVLWAEKEDHKRQRKALSPAFSVSAIRNVLTVFFDSAYKVKSAWDSLIDASSTGSATIDVQSWMNHVSLDSIGVAGFSWNFGTLEGKRSEVAESFDNLGNTQPSRFGRITFMLASIFPLLARLPSPRRAAVQRLTASMEVIAAQLLQNTRKEMTGDAKMEDKSIIGTLIKAENSQTGLHMTQQEVTDQMKLLILAGYETTSISLTWALLELSRNPEIQHKLRKELEEYGTDPTWDDLMHGLPYLDAVLHETLRMHPPVRESVREADADDIIPLSEPLRLSSGQVVDRITVCKGQSVGLSISCINRSEAIWGPSAKVYNPERWLDADGLPSKAQEVQGHRHLLTFADGPRICIGRTFAQAEFKAVLSVLIRSYSFELKDGPKTEIETKRGVLPRPTIKGAEGVHMPLVVKRLD